MVIERDVQKLAQTLRDWEMDAGESFTDYYMDDRVKPVSWAFWLLGKGYTEKANKLIDDITARRSVGQMDTFHIHYADGMSWSDWDAADATYFKDFLIWADFLCASDRYFKDIKEWLEDWFKDDDECDNV